LVKFGKFFKGGAPLKKPPYRVYRKKEEKKPQVQIPEEIDTPQAEQLVEDFYAVLNFLEKHKAKFLLISVSILLAIFAYAGYKFYFSSTELKAAKLTDKATYYLNTGNTKKALIFLKKTAKDYGNFPSGKLAKFLLGKLEKDERALKSLAESEDYLLSSPSKTSLGALLIDEGKLKKAEVVLRKVKRENWTHPEAVYDELLISLISGKKENVENYFNVLKGDYGTLPITELAKELLK
jgi:predicted negative regulator of RcsB-dependent stress response